MKTLIDDSSTFNIGHKVLLCQLNEIRDTHNFPLTTLSLQLNCIKPPKNPKPSAINK